MSSEVIFHVGEQQCDRGFRVEVTTSQGALRYDLRFWGCRNGGYTASDASSRGTLPATPTATNFPLWSRPHTSALRSPRPPFDIPGLLHLNDLESPKSVERQQIMIARVVPSGVRFKSCHQNEGVGH